MSSSALPPPSNLPSWSRVSTLDRSRYPKPFLRDRLPLAPGGATTITKDFNTSLGNVDVKFLEKMSKSGQHQSICYDKSIKFLQQQHAETLRKLHDELEMLKRENKDLQFKVIFAHQGSPLPGAPNAPTVPYTQNAPSDIKTLLLQEEIKDLKQALQESSDRNHEMLNTIFSLQSRVVNTTDDRKKFGDTEGATKTHRRKFSVSSLSTPLPHNASLNPLRVRDSHDEAPRVPSVTECEAIIQKMHETNCQQLVELSKLRTDLRNVASASGNSTPEAYTMKTYGPLKNESFSDTRLPRIPVKPATKKSIKSANMAEMKVTLPALKNTISSNVADRQKRQHAMQKQQKNIKKY